MVYKHKIIDKIKKMNASEDFVSHIENVTIESGIADRTLEEYLVNERKEFAPSGRTSEGGLDGIERRVPESAYEVYLKVGAPFASMNKHFRKYGKVKPLTEIYDDEIDVKEYENQVKKYPNDYFIIIKDPSMWDVFEQAFNDYPVEGECFVRNNCGVFRFENFDYNEKENLASYLTDYINDSIRDNETRRMAKKGKENFEDSSIYKIENGSVREV